jgi:diguanylate cyclase (GGDEF)-like protein
MATTLVFVKDTPFAGVPAFVTALATIGITLPRGCRDQSRHAMPWRLCAASLLAFMLGGVLRHLLAGTELTLLADAVTLLGYLGWVVFFLRVLGLRQDQARGAHEFVDALIVLVASACLVIVLVVVPTIEQTGPTLFALLQVGYPLIDVAVGFAVLLLGMTSARRTPAFWLLAASVLAVLIGDIGYGRIAVDGATVGSPLLDLPFLLAYATFGAAWLHPSVTLLAAPEGRPVQEWSGGRLAILVPALLVGPVVVLAAHSRAGAWAGSIASASVAGLLLWRAVGAVRALARSQSDLHHRATHDALTGLANRAALMTRLQHLLAVASGKGGSVHVLFLDLDGFKLINDAHGHHTGDRVLNTTASRLRDLAGPRDVVARIGGDEFVMVCLVGRGDRDGAQAATAIIEAFKAPMPAREGAFVATVSIGLAVSRPGVSPERLLRDADAAMYHAKSLGKNCVATFTAVERDASKRGARDRGPHLPRRQTPDDLGRSVKAGFGTADAP